MGEELTVVFGVMSDESDGQNGPFLFSLLDLKVDIWVVLSFFVDFINNPEVGRISLPTFGLEGGSAI
ncbi:hypothetical protein EGR_07464 [Echinococcus granulosus]|uniref:Uncharacterized protein n=1 Tax=Echinococcus granulosus TaxID=6210 RepID=W6UHT6_ECHGR|nr:hypothetical protein EGR_07464 [Echinococcus granulosus]EUB57657.1 hypothetical protein EGR_07464 [Echinococcus granulosus]